MSRRPLRPGQESALMLAFGGIGFWVIILGLLYAEPLLRALDEAQP